MTAISNLNPYSSGSYRVLTAFWATARISPYIHTHDGRFGKAAQRIGALGQ